MPSIVFEQNRYYELYSQYRYYESYSQMPSIVFELQELTDQSPLATVVCPTFIRMHNDDDYDDNYGEDDDDDDNLDDDDDDDDDCPTSM